MDQIEVSTTRGIMKYGSSNKLIQSPSHSAGNRSMVKGGKSSRKMGRSTRNLVKTPARMIKKR